MSCGLARGGSPHLGQARPLGLTVGRQQEGGGRTVHEGDEGMAAGMTEESLRRLVASLTEAQREAIMDEVHQMHAAEVKKKAEGNSMVKIRFNFDKIFVR